MDLSEYLFEQFRLRVTKIVRNKESKRIPEFKDVQNFYKTFSEFIFVFDKFIDSKIQPVKWNIYHSKALITSKLSPKSLKQFDRLEKLLKAGDIKVNSPSLGYLPKSGKDYYLTHFEDSENYRYSIDFTNQLFGIRHLHLDSHNKDEDTLLFYVIIGDSLYMLRIGGHNDLYTDNNIRVLVEEFPGLLNRLKIHDLSYPVIEPKPTFTIEEIKKMWSMGHSIGFWINDRYYSTINLQTSSRLSIDHMSQIQNMYYQVQVGVQDFTAKLNELHSINKDEKTITVKHNNEYNDFHDNCLILKDATSNEEYRLCLSIISKLKYIDRLLAELDNAL